MRIHIRWIPIAIQVSPVWIRIKPRDKL